MTELRRHANWQTVFFTLKDPENGACLGVTIARSRFDALRLDLANGERAHVFGISMGGMIAQDLVLKHPDLVRKLVLTGTGSTFCSGFHIGAFDDLPRAVALGDLLKGGIDRRDHGGTLVRPPEQ